MTPRERVLAALSHKETDKVPFSMGFGVNHPVRVAMAPRLGLRDAAEVDAFLRGLSDLRWAYPEFKGPPERRVNRPDGTSVDMWGVTRKPVSYGPGTYSEICGYPLADVSSVSDLDSFLWPSVDWFDFDGFADKVRAAGEDGRYALCISFGNIFESSWYMRGFEAILTDVAESPELVWEIFRRVTDFFVAFHTRVHEEARGLFDIVFTADDIGGQEGLIMSPSMWEGMLKPHHARLNRLIHGYGPKVMYHSDGAVMDAVPGLIDMGIDVLEALQFDAKGMDPVALKAGYGDRLSFHGGVSVQHTLPWGTEDEVRREVRDRIKVLGKGGGYILAPSHAVQAGTPVGNVIAFLEEAGRI